jgi:DNA mismatch repair ATPase MutS
MRFSLLEKLPDTYAECGVLYDISADRAIKNIITDKRKAEYFISILEKPLTNVENITFRQEIFDDLCSIDGLHEQLKTLFSRYDRIKSDWQEMKLGAVNGRGSDINSEALLEHTFSSLKVTAIFPSTIASFFGTIGQTLSAYPVKSEGLCSIRDWCREMSENEALNELVDISQRFRYKSHEDFDFTVVYSLDHALRLLTCDVSDITEKKQTGGIAKLFSKKKEKEGITVTAELSEAGEDPLSDAQYILNEALARIDAALTRVTTDVYEAFFGLSNELMFYEAALAYYNKAKADGVPTVMPRILPETADRFDAKGLRELVLLSNGAGGRTVPNDLVLTEEQSGLLVKGLTDSGKTVYLRSIAAAQLFAQAGLPVLAEEAEISVRRGFFSHFSSAEEEFLIGDAKGRFDQEAREIAAILNRLTPYSFLLLNETFQTTSYKEGTESIYNILRFMPKLKTKYVFVTHLTALFGYMENENAILAHTSDDPESKYKIIIDQK